MPCASMRRPKCRSQTKTKHKVAQKLLTHLYPNPVDPKSNSITASRPRLFKLR